MKLPTCRRHILSFLLSLLLGGGALGAQDAALPGVFGEVLEVRVINIEVVVTDRDGLRVPNLEVGDFQLLVDGEEVPIEYFTEILAGTAVAGSTPTEGVEEMPSIEAGKPVGTSYLVFIDDYFSRANDRKVALKALAADLSHLGPEDRMAIVAYDGRGVEMLTSWSDEVPVLLRALNQADERPAFGLQRLAEERQYDIDTILTAAGSLVGDNLVFADDAFRRLDPDERFYAERLAEQVERSVAAATATMRGFAQPPGRKVMLMLSGGWPFLPAEFVVNSYTRAVFLEPGLSTGDQIFRPLVDTANMLGYTLYPVDVPGIEFRSAVDASRRNTPLSNTVGDQFLRENENHYTLEFLARETGGKALLNAGRGKALQEAAADTRSYYWLGFSPERSGNDEDHSLEVRVRGEKLKVRTRRGFVDSSIEREVSMSVESALLFGNPPSTDPLALSFGRPKKVKGKGVAVELTVGIPLDSVILLPHGEGWRAAVELRVAVLDTGGRQADIPVVPLEMIFEKKPPSGQFATYVTTLQIRPQEHDIVVAVYDPASGRILSGQAVFAP